VHNDDMSTALGILSSDEVRRDGDLGRKEWMAGAAPLHTAAGLGRNELVRVLVKSGVDVDSVGVGDVDRCTSLHLAVHMKQAETVRLLLDLGADSALEGKMGEDTKTPLEWARFKGHDDIAKMLKAQSSD
jgi:ankyrin repeat protein